MLVQNENDKAVDRMILPYRELAVAVIHSALVDFGERRSDRRPRGRLAGPRPYKDRSTDSKLSALRHQIRAGAFLVERDDELTLMWFSLAGLDLAMVRKEKPHWRFKLKAMRAREEVLAANLLAQLRRQMAINREGKRADTGDSSVGRHVVEPGGLQGRGVQQEDRVGGGRGDRPEDVLRRPGRAAAHVDGSSERSRCVPYGRLVGSLGDVPWVGAVPQRESEAERVAV
jgi:hypothetical protein